MFVLCDKLNNLSSGFVLQSTDVNINTAMSIGSSVYKPRKALSTYSNKTVSKQPNCH